jgi:hypothetical protein
LVLLNAGVGHDLDGLSQAVRAQCPKARVLAASCAGVVGREGPGESIHDVALMGISGEGFTISYVDGLYGGTSFDKGVELARGRRLFNRVIKEELVHRMQQPFANDGAVPPWFGM